MERIQIGLDDFLIKAVNTAGNAKTVYVEASNENRDLQNEVILQKALKDSVNYFLSEGVFSYDHLHKLNNFDPDFILGEPDDVKFANDDNKTTLVKGHFYNDDKPDSLVNKVYKKIIQKSRLVRASVGGGIVEKSNGMIKSVKWDEVAFSFKPVNNTLKSASIMPIGEFAKSFYSDEKIDNTNELMFDTIDSIGIENISKALQTGIQTDSMNMTGGQSLIKQDIYTKSKEEQKAVFKDLFINIVNGTFKTEKSLNDYLQEMGLSNIKPYLYEYILKNKGRF